MESPRAITKIIVPSKRGDLLHRPRLINFLHEHIQRKLILISASAGYGKTSLLIDFAHDTPLPVCWYSLDASDGDPKTFLEYIVTSLRRTFPDFGARTLGLLADASLLQQSEAIVGTLVTEIYENIPGYFVLILDDYHVVEPSEPVNRILDSLLRLLPENAHIILASRTLPSKLTLTRLAARQEIAGLGTNDLRFNPEETRSLFRQNYQVELNVPQAEELADQSEGWITGILLTTHSLWKGLFQDLMRLRGSQSQVFDYLASEVFALQTPDVQRFLLESSILDNLGPAFCDELLSTHDAESILQMLEQQNLFLLRVEGEETFFRYHHLFQEFLQTRLRELDPARAMQLHRRAASLFESRQMWDQAIRHHQRAEAFDAAALVVERVAKDTFDAGQWATLARWIDEFPSQVLDAHPNLLTMRGLILSSTGEQQQALDLYSRALELHQRRGDTRSIGQLFIKQAACHRVQSRYAQAIELCHRALEILDDDAPEDVAEAHRMLGLSYGYQGNWGRGIQELELALQVQQSLDNQYRVAWLHQDLGTAYRTTGSPSSQLHFQAALEYWRHSGNTVCWVTTLNSIGVGYHHQGDYDQAIAVLGEARSEARRSGHLRIQAFSGASLGDVYRDRGELARALPIYLEAYESARKIGGGFITTYVLSALGETYCRMNDLETANQLLQQALEQAENHHSEYERGLVKTSVGIVRFVRGDCAAAVEHLTDAVKLLEESSAKRDSARAHLHLANVLLAQRKYRAVNQHLKAIADLGTQIQEDQFIVADGPYILPLLRYAALKKLGNGYFAGISDKIRWARTSDSHSQVDEPKDIRLQVRAFGTAEVVVDGKLVSKTEWDSATTKELFFFLLAHPEGMRKEKILTSLWGDVEPPRASSVFHSSLYRMRRAVAPICVIKEDGLYRINPELQVWFDVAEFDRLIQQAETETDENVAASTRLDATALYRGEYLEESYGDWCAPIRAVLHDKYLSALLALERHYERQSDLSKAIAMCEKVLEKDQYREDVYRNLMRLQAQGGNPTAALKTYQRCIDALAEAHLSPSSETQALFESIVSSEDPSLP